jgi:hypothetical protein
MLQCEPTQTTMTDPVSLMIKQPRTEDEAIQMKAVPYREAIGSVLYLALRTRPDIAVAVSILSKHVQEPRPAHWEGVKRILRYLKGTMMQGRQYLAVPGERSSLFIHSNADWGTDPEDRRSRTSVVCRLGGNVVSWTSRKQTTPAVSSCEAEYAALLEAGRDAVWIRSLLCEVGQCPGREPTLVYYDNQDFISWAEGELRKVKHVELKYHFRQHLIQSGQVEMRYVPSEDNIADGLTKALAGAQF